MRIRLVPAAAAVLVAAAAGQASVSAAAPQLVGTVGPGFTITLTKGGKLVKALKAGSYRFVVHDKASIHDFALHQTSGGTLNKELTSVPFAGTKTITLKLGKGTYKYFCTPHQSIMSGSFKVS